MIGSAGVGVLHAFRFESHVRHTNPSHFLVDKICKSPQKKVTNGQEATKTMDIIPNTRTKDSFSLAGYKS